MSKVRNMTEEEKEKFLSKVKIETEDIPTTVDPLDVFVATVSTYNDNMREQIERINTSLPLHYEIKQMVEEQLDYTFDRNTHNNCETSDEALKTELQTRTEIITKMIQSKLLMEERLRMSEKVIEFCKNNFNDILDLDFYFGGALRLPQTEDKIEKILESL